MCLIHFRMIELRTKHQASATSMKAEFYHKSILSQKGSFLPLGVNNTEPSLGQHWALSMFAGQVGYDKAMKSESGGQFWPIQLVLWAMNVNDITYINLPEWLPWDFKFAKTAEVTKFLIFSPGNPGKASDSDLAFHLSCRRKREGHLGHLR